MTHVIYDEMCNDDMTKTLWCNKIEINFEGKKKKELERAKIKSD